MRPSFIFELPIFHPPEHSSQTHNCLSLQSIQQKFYSPFGVSIMKKCLLTYWMNTRGKASKHPEWTLGQKKWSANLRFMGGLRHLFACLFLSLRLLKLYSASWVEPSLWLQQHKSMLCYVTDHHATWKTRSVEIFARFLFPTATTSIIGWFSPSTIIATNTNENVTIIMDFIL